jgi:hypothetical protein
MTILIGLSYFLYIQLMRLKLCLQPLGAFFCLQSLGSFFCLLVLCLAIHCVLFWHLFGWFFAQRYQLPVTSLPIYLRHLRVQQKRWWRVSQFLGFYYAIPWALWLLRLARVKSRIQAHEYVREEDEEDGLWLRDLNNNFNQQLEQFNEREMLPLDRSGGFYLNFEDFCFPDFGRFLDGVSASPGLFVDSYSQIGRCTPGLYTRRGLGSGS